MGDVTERLRTKSSRLWHGTECRCESCRVAVEAELEIKQLRTAGEKLRQALLVVSNQWGRRCVEAEDAKYHLMVDHALDTWKELKHDR